MVANWDQNRQGLPPDQTVMITDSSNEERDEMNALAQDRRAQAGELGEHRVELPDKPYGLAAGDEVIFTDKFRIRRLKRVENGITGTVIHASSSEDKVTIRTRETKPRDVEVDTEKFSEISLAYAVHIRKGQGLTTETSGILAGGWQTDREHMYVSLSRARERTDVYISREDLGEQGMDTGAIERLGERMARSRAQEATITKDVAEPTAEPERTAQPERTAEQPTQIEPATPPMPEPSRQQPADIEPPAPDTPDPTVDHPEPQRSAKPSHQHEPAPQSPDHAERQHSTEPPHQQEPSAPTAEPAVQQRTESPSASKAPRGTQREIDETLKDRRARQFDWQRAADVDRSGTFDEQSREVEAIEHLAEQLRREGASEATITQQIAKQTAGREADLERNTQAQREHERYIDKVLEQQRGRLLDEEQRHTEQAKDADRDPDRTTGDRPSPIVEPAAGRDSYIEQAIEAERDRQQAWERDTEPDRNIEPDRDRDIQQATEEGRDPVIEQAIQEERDRQENWERGIDSDRDNDRGYGIE